MLEPTSARRGLDFRIEQSSSPLPRHRDCQLISGPLNRATVKAERALRVRYSWTVTTTIRDAQEFPRSAQGLMRTSVEPVYLWIVVLDAIRNAPVTRGNGSLRLMEGADNPRTTWTGGSGNASPAHSSRNNSDTSDGLACNTKRISAVDAPRLPPKP